MIMISGLIMIAVLMVMIYKSQNKVVDKQMNLVIIICRK